MDSPGLSWVMWLRMIRERLLDMSWPRLGKIENFQNLLQNLTGKSHKICLSRWKRRQRMTLMVTLPAWLWREVTGRGRSFPVNSLYIKRVLLSGDLDWLKSWWTRRLKPWLRPSMQSMLHIYIMQTHASPGMSAYMWGRVTGQLSISTPRPLDSSE